MEMVQFHPTGLIAGDDTRITGTIIEEGLRGAGGYLMDVHEKRFMGEYDEREERATRDIVSRAMYDLMQDDSRTGPNGGLYITMRHLDPKMVAKQFKGMVDRCRDVGFDLVGGLVEVVPTAHYMMGVKSTSIAALKFQRSLSRARIGRRARRQSAQRQRGRQFNRVRRGRRRRDGAVGPRRRPFRRPGRKHYRGSRRPRPCFGKPEGDINEIRRHFIRSCGTKSGCPDADRWHVARQAWTS